MERGKDYRIRVQTREEVTFCRGFPSLMKYVHIVKICPKKEEDKKLTNIISVPAQPGPLIKYVHCTIQISSKHVSHYNCAKQPRQHTSKQQRQQH